MHKNLYNKMTSPYNFCFMILAILMLMYTYEDYLSDSCIKNIKLGMALTFGVIAIL